MLIRFTVLVAFAAAPLTAQSLNATLLGTHDQHGTYNDIWGYAAPNGKEYALLGTRTGVAVIDVTNPANPQERGFFNGPSSTWRDIRTYGTYAYAVTEATGGMQVIDLTNPDMPTLVGQLHTSRFGNAHNISVDEATGWIYVVGTNAGTVVFDASSSPANPSYVGTYGNGSRSSYFHDFQAQNGLGYGSMIYNGVLRILDVSSWPFSTISERTTPSSFTHQAWPNANDSLVVTVDERTGAVMKVWDITNPANPQSRGTFTPNPSAIPHNVFVIGDLVYASWYTEGLRVIDISDPNNPTEVAYYDTWSGPSGGYNGAWGCYPFLPSGNVLVSDISTGLYVIKVGDCVPAQHYGAGTAGTSGIVPAIDLSGHPRIGTTFDVVGSSILGGAPSLLAVGFQSASLPIQGITGLVDPSAAALLFQVASGSAGSPGAGTASWSFSLPNSTALDDLNVYTQVVTLDAAGPAGLAASDGLNFQVCRL